MREENEAVDVLVLGMLGIANGSRPIRWRWALSSLSIAEVIFTAKPVCRVDSSSSILLECLTDHSMLYISMFCQSDFIPWLNVLLVGIVTIQQPG